MNANTLILPAFETAAAKARCRSSSDHRSPRDDGSPGASEFFSCLRSGVARYRTRKWRAGYRVLRDSTLDEWEVAGCPPPGRPSGEGEYTAVDSDGRHFLRYDDAPPRSNLSGNHEAKWQYAGTSREAISDIPSVDTLMRQLWSDCQSAYGIPFPL